MLQTVTIQNFKSLRDVTVRLQKVNLLIGPNNSGKSNFLKALATIRDFYDQRIAPPTFDFERIYYKQAFKDAFTRKYPIKFGFVWDSLLNVGGAAVYQLELIDYENYLNGNLKYSEGYGISETAVKSDFRLLDTKSIVTSFNEFTGVYIGERPNYSTDEIFKPITDHYKRNSNSLLLLYHDYELSCLDYNHPNGLFLKKLIHTEEELSFDIEELLTQTRIYKPEPSKIAKESLLLFDKHVNEDCSNLVAFLDNMRDEHPNVWKAIERDLNKCIPDFEGINFGKVTIKSNLNVEGRTESIGKRFGLRDKHGKTYWADELSEGTIYFLALLAIVHQPNPPKVLLLEEPEKGIHPRRIAEVMDLIFRLAEEKDIQIILTSHSTQVVDAFQDIPESVFVFDMVDGETKIKNLQTDILESDAKDAQQKNFPKIDYSKRSLGEHWAIGLLGGVPV